MTFLILIKLQKITEESAFLINFGELQIGDSSGIFFSACRPKSQGKLISDTSISLKTKSIIVLFFLTNRNDLYELILFYFILFLSHFFDFNFQVGNGSFSVFKIANDFMVRLSLFAPLWIFSQ